VAGALEALGVPVGSTHARAAVRASSQA
jgi:hypothetical protein